MVESSFEDMLGGSKEISFDEMVGGDSSFEDMLGPGIKKVEDPSLVYEATPPAAPETALEAQMRAMQPQRTEYDVKDTDPLITQDMKNGFMETLKGYGHLATHPYEVLQGAVDFVSSIPGFLTGVPIAARNIASQTLHQLANPKTIPGTDMPDVGGLDFLELYDAASKGMAEGMEFFEPGKKALFGEPSKQSQLVGATAMAPLIASNKIASELADWEGFKDSPNTRGALKFMGDALGFLALGYLHRGPKPELTRKFETVAKKANDIKVAADIIAKTPDEAMRRAQERVLKVQKKQVELEAEALKEEVKAGVDLDPPIKEDLKAKGEEVKARKAGYKDPEFKEVDGVEYIKQGKEWFDPTGKKLEAEQIVPEIKKTKTRTMAEEIMERRKKADEKLGKVEGEELVVEEDLDLPTTELDRQTGEPTPPSIEGESNPFFQTAEQAEGMRKVYEGRKIEDIEVGTQKTINDANVAYHAGDEVALGKVRDALSDLAVRGDELRGQFITGADHATWMETVSDAAEWARGLRLENQRRGDGPQLNMMIPLDMIPGTVLDIINTGKKGLDKLIGYLKRDKLSMKDLYRNKEIFDETGFWLGKDGMWRFEIDDSKVKYDWNKLNKVGFHIDEGALAIKLFEVLDAPELYKSVPKLKDTILVTDEFMPRKTSGYFDPKDNTIKIKYNADKRTLLHELQHAINDAVGSEFKGTNVSEAGSKNRYLKDLGEMEARVVENRMDLTAKERREIPPWETLDEMLKYEKIPQDVGTKLYSGLPLDEMGKKLVAMADKAIAAGKKAREFKKFKPLETTKLLNEKYKRNFVDRSGNIRLSFLRNLDDVGYKIIQRMYLTKGADPLSTMELHQMRKELTSGMSRNEKRIWSDVIFNTRMADIAGYKPPKDFRFPEGSSPLESAAYLELWAQREKITPERAQKIQSSVDGYFEWMKKKLDDMEAEGLITTQEKTDLAAHKYSKVKLVDILDRENKLTIGGKKRSVHDSGIETLAKGRETDILERDAEILALEHFERINGRILHNRANKLLLDLAKNDSKNPFVRVRKSNEGIPKGWQKIFVYEEGVRNTIHISPEMAKEWVTSNPEITYKTGQVMKYISASPMLKTFATGIEWTFALKNVPRDIMHIYYAARVFENGKMRSVYSDHLPVFLPQIAMDIARVFPDVVAKGKNLQGYYSRGGGMDFLTSQGLLLRRGRKLDSNISNAQKALSRFGEISELTTRRAIEEHVIRKRAKEKGISVEEARKDRELMDEATFAAIDYMHFSQGGGIAKAADNGIPYLNARIQASRGLWRVAKENPGTFIYKTGQLMALTTVLYHAMRTQTPLTTEALQGSSDLKNNYCIPVGDDHSFVDEKGQTRYWGFKIPIDPAQKFFKGLTEAIYDKTVGNEIDVEGVIKNLSELSPVESAPLFPTITGALEYTQNKNFWTGDDAWRMTDPFPWSTVDEDGKWVGSSKEFTSRTPEVLKDIGEVTKLSPERLKTAAGELVTENSTWMYLLGKGYDKLFKDVPKSEKKKQWQMVLKEFPITSSFLFVTNPYTKHAVDIEKDVHIDALKKLNQRTELDRLVDGFLFQKSYERSDVNEYIRSFKDIRIKERLQKRFDFSYATRALPDRSFWMRLQHLDPEVRAKQYYKAEKSGDVDSLAEGRRIIGSAGGFFSDNFWNELNKIRRGEKVEE